MKISVCNLLNRFAAQAKFAARGAKAQKFGECVKKNRVEYRCKKCHYHFSDTSGTIFEKTKVSLSKWILAIGLWKIGISGLQL